MFAIVLLICTVSLVSGCRPGFPIHPQNRFCKSERAIIGEVLIDKQSLGKGSTTQIRYRVRIQAVLKGYPHNKVGQNIYIYTTKSSSMCKIDLKGKKSYVLGGRSKGNDMDVIGHDLVIDASKLTWQQQMFLFSTTGPNSYKDNCNCEITSTSSDSSCGVPYIKHECYAKKGICSNQSGQCAWVNDNC